MLRLIKSRGIGVPVPLRSLILLVFFVLPMELYTNVLHCVREETDKKMNAILTSQASYSEMQFLEELALEVHFLESHCQTSNSTKSH